MAANLISFLLLTLFFWGRSLRFKNLRLHILVMLGAFAGDFLLVLALVLMKDALSQVSPDMHWTLQIHIPIAISTLVFYALTSRAGFRLYGGDESARPLLRRLDKILVALRVLTLITSLMVSTFRVES